MTRREKALEIFKAEHNCSQTIVLTFSDMIDMDAVLLARMAQPLGGGVGRLRNICGAVSGMAMVLGALYGREPDPDQEGKKLVYSYVQECAAEFEKIYGTVICKDLLEIVEVKKDPVPQKRDEEYYATRPCARIVEDAAEILERFIETHPVEK